MPVKLKHKHRRARPDRIDPTRTVTVRKRYVAEIRRRFARLRGDIVRLLMDDVFGIKRRLVGNVFCATGEGGGVDPTCSPLAGQLKTYAKDPITSKKISYVSGAAFRGDDVEDAGISAGATDEHIAIAKEITKRIADAPVRTDEAYRAVAFSKGEDRKAQLALKKALDGATVGSQLTIDRIASFTSDESQLDHYFSDEYHGEEMVDKYKLVMRGRYKAIATDQYTGMTHKELLTQGVFDVTDVSHSNGIKTIGLRQRIAPTTNAADDDLKRTWQFKTSSEQVKAFQEWLRERFGHHLSIKQLMKRFAEEGYKRGIGRAFDDVEKPYAQGFAMDFSTGDFYKPSKLQFLKSAFGSPVGKERVEQLASRSFDDLKNVTSDMSTRMSRTLLEGLVDGSHPNEIAKQLSKDVDISLGRAETIARTEIIRAHAEGQLDAMEKMGVAEVGVQVEWTTARDDKVCPYCESMEGIVLDIQKAHNLIPAHPNCLPGDSLVTSVSRIAAASKRWYDGDMFVINTASGRVLRCTPNHPILTGHGWVAANLLSVGNDVICDGRDEWKPTGVDHDNVNAPTFIHDIAESLRRSCHVSTAEVPTSAPDFHGDGMEGDVAVIWSNGELRTKLGPAFDQHSSKFQLSLRGVGRLSLDALRSVAKLFLGSNRTTSSVVGSNGLLSSRFGVHLRPLNGLGFTLRPERNTSLEQDTVDDTSRYAALSSNDITRLTRQVVHNDIVNGQRCRFCERAVFVAEDANDYLDSDAELASQLASGSSGPVFADKVVSLVVEKFSGHVYNLETEKGFYTANGIITHNCRCAFMPAGDVLYPKPVGDVADEGFTENQRAWRITDLVNVFCPTGEGGGVDPTCSPGGSSSDTVGAPKTNPANLAAASALIAKLKGYKTKAGPARVKQLADALSKLTVKQLNELKAEHAIDVKGKKAELIERLTAKLKDKINAEKGKTVKVDPPVKPPPSPTPNDPISALPKDATVDQRLDAVYAHAMKEHPSQMLDKENKRFEELKTLIFSGGKYIMSKAEYDKRFKEYKALFDKKHHLLVNRQEIIAKQRETLLRALTVETPADVKVGAGVPTGKPGAGYEPKLPEEKEAMDNAVKFVQALTAQNGQDDPLTFRFYKHASNGRAHQTQREYINVGVSQKDAGVIVHEMAHAIENQKPGVLEQMRNFLAERTKGETPQKITFIDSSKPEYGLDDDFKKVFGASARYVGKTYPNNTTMNPLTASDTEVLSMGLQQLYEDPIRFIRKDREYAKLVIEVLRDRTHRPYATHGGYATI